MPCGSFVSARTEVRGGGSWNAPVDSTSNEFAYVAIPEPRAIHAGMEKPHTVPLRLPYRDLVSPCQATFARDTCILILTLTTWRSDHRRQQQSALSVLRILSSSAVPC